MAIRKEVFAAALAHGLDPRVIDTWHADLPRTPRVLVPIRVDALVVRARGGNWADCRMRDPAPGADTVDSASLMPAPFANIPGGRERGVYLHWALPDALTRGVGSSGEDGAGGAPQGVSFPTVPDRWLVMRIGGDDISLSRRKVTGWVLESGGLVPRVTPLASWTEPGPLQPTGDGPEAGTGNRPRQPLTALGHGDAAWAAYFDNVTNRLGFVDPLDKVREGPLAYLVCGWYADPSRDVLGDGIRSLAAFERRLAELRWEVPPGSYGQTGYSKAHIDAAAGVGLPTREAAKSYEVQSYGRAQKAQVGVDGSPIDGRYTIADAFWPRYILCHGGVVGIGWPNVGIPVAAGGLLGGGEELGGPPPADQVRVVMGHTLTDAMSALLAANNRTPDEARALEIALLGAADDLDAADAAAQIDTRVHAASFGSLPSAPTTEVIQQRRSSGAPQVAQPDPSKTDPGIFADKRPQPPRKGGKGGKPSARDDGAFVSISDSKQASASGVKVHHGGKVADIIATRLEQLNADFRVDVADVPLRNVVVSRASPRYFIPPDPVFLLQGIGRSFKHGGDGLYSEHGLLPCRVSGLVTRQLAPTSLKSSPRAGVVTGEDLLGGSVSNGGVPPECNELLYELALLDPGSATFAARVGSRGKKRLPTRQVDEAARTYAVEQTAWWATWDPRRDSAPLAAKSGFSGTLPCGLAVSAPFKPWVPLHLDWEIEYVPTAAVSDWQLGEVDFDAKPGSIPAVGAIPAGTVLSGRALLTGGAAQTAAAALRQTLERAASAGGSAALEPGSTAQYNSELSAQLLAELTALDDRGRLGEEDLRSLVEALAEMDVLSGALDRFHTRLRGGYIADGRAKPDAAGAPPGYNAFRAGFLRIRRLRLVDCFGQFIDLAGSSALVRADMDNIARSEPMTVEGRKDLIELAPRFTAPARLMFRFLSAASDAVEANDQTSPVCGFLLPDHLDAELQFHAADGKGHGAVRFDAAAGVRWEDEPGSPRAAGAGPEQVVTNPHLARIARGLLDWGVADTTRNDPAHTDTALSSLLRIIDTTLWTVDPFAHTGDEHLSLLVGHPIAVMRARLSLDVAEPIEPNALQGLQVPVRIGALAHWQDGLLGYFVDDDYRTLHLPDPASAGFARPIGPGQGFLQQATQTTNYYQNFADDIGVAAVEGASAIDHDYVDTSGVVMLRPGQVVTLTLLMEPHGVVHATSGLLPRKAIGMRREWVASGLSNIAPTFRFGPVLVDAKRVRMPVASEIKGTWSWCHRVAPTSWQEDEVVNSRSDAQLPTSPVEGQEGWLKLTPEKPADTP